MDKQEYKKQWDLKNRERMLGYFKKYNAARKDALKVYKKQYYETNREKLAETRKKRAADPAYKDQCRRNSLKTLYGITVEQFELMAEAQGYKCAGCGVDEPGGKGRWNVDHCHQSDKIRGLLCMSCNVTLGMVGDNENVLQGLIDYLRKYKT